MHGRRHPFIHTSTFCCCECLTDIRGRRTMKFVNFPHHKRLCYTSNLYLLKGMAKYISQKFYLQRPSTLTNQNPKNRK